MLGANEPVVGLGILQVGLCGHHQSHRHCSKPMLGSSVADCCTPFHNASLLQATNQVLAFVKGSGGHVHAYGWQLVGAASGCSLVDQQVQVDGAHMLVSRQKPAACHHHIARQHPVLYMLAVCLGPASACQPCL